MITFLRILTFTLITSNIYSQETCIIDNSIYRPEIKCIKSEYVEHMEYKIHITLPTNYKSSSTKKKYPVLYYLDAWECSGTMGETANRLMYRDLIKQTILVGISLDGGVKAYFEQRNRDFLPNLKNESITSGADNFLNFIQKELIPFIEKNYSTDSLNRGLFGYSYGGLFATYVLKKQPHLFNTFGICSPALWHQKFKLLEDKQLINNINNSKQINILTTYGSLEPESIITGAETFYKLASKNKNIYIKKMIFEDEGHTTAFTLACSKLLSHLYKK